jgi:serine/threonine protein kinase
MPKSEVRMSHSWEMEIDELTVYNAEITGIILDSGLVSVDDLSRCHRDLDKRRAQGEPSVNLLDYMLSEGVLDQKAYDALEKACSRSARDRENSLYQIPGFQTIRKIGSGALGDVILARQVSMKRLVAIKILNENWFEDEEFKNRFLLEARVLGRLSHQNLVQVYDVGLKGKSYYFSMEYVDGPTVERLIQEEGHLDQLKALDLTIQTAKAIDYISKYEIVHRDVKPANIMLNENGVVKLGDFGFLHSKHEDKVENDGVVLGTPDYISPEQACGKSVDFRSDIYSLGVTLYQMLTGTLPYEGSASAVMEKHLTAALPERRPIDGQKISPHIYNLICKMMAKNPSDRYESTEELIDDLQYYEAKERLKSDDGLRGEVIKEATENTRI